MKKWIVYNKKAPFKEIGDKFHIDPVIARVIRNRDIVEMDDIKEYLYGDENSLYNPHLMKDIDKCADILIEKIHKGKKIRIVNDYDVDGITSGYELLKSLTRAGADVSIRTPDRIKDGYGINKQIIQEAIDSGVDTILTCDNGIAAIDEIAFAKENGITVLVTDHHSVPYEEINGERVYKKSSADAIVNPHQEECHYPYEGLCGAGVAWKLICVLYEKMDIPKEEAYALLEITALGTVADVMDLTGENRIITKLGLRQMRETKNKGLKALIKANSMEPAKLSAYHFGFVIGPCMNACGRLQTAELALRLLNEEDEEKADELAHELVELNATRKEMTAKGQEQALMQIEELHMEHDKVLVVYLPDVHESLAGIIAGKIREQYYRPVFVLTKGKDGVKGSGRSIEEYSMYDEMVKCSDCLEHFGGHPMAAGLSLKEENVEKFRKEMNAKATLSEDDMIEKVHIDVPMPIDYATMDLIYEFSLLEPFGKGNVKPVFACKDIRFSNGKILGVSKNVLKMSLTTVTGAKRDGILFGGVNEFLTYVEEKFGVEECEKFMNGAENAITMSIIYEPSINSFRGVDSMQFVIKDYQ